MSVIFGADAFTVGADANIDQYPSSGDPDYAYSRGSGSNILINASVDKAVTNVTGSDLIARVIDPAVGELSTQEVRCDVSASGAGGTNEPGAALRYSSSTRGYIGHISPASANDIELVEDNAGFTSLTSADRALSPTTTYPLSVRAVGTTAVWLTLIANNTAALTFADTSSVIASGRPGMRLLSSSIANTDTFVDNFVVDDLKEYPQVAGIATTNGSTATTSAQVNLPSGCQAGDTLIIVHRNAAGGTITFPSEGTAWVQLFEDSSDASDDTTAAAWRKCDGTEGATITVSQGTSGKFASVVYLVTNAADPTLRAPEFASLVTGTSTTPNPGTVTPTGGSKPYLFIWVGAWEGEQTSPPASFPTNYNSATGANSGTAGAVTTNCQIATAHRETTASSEDAGSWTISVSDDWTATTIAVHPPQLNPSAYGRPDGQVGQRLMNQLLSQ